MNACKICILLDVEGRGCCLGENQRVRERAWNSSREEQGEKLRPRMARGTSERGREPAPDSPASRSFISRGDRQKCAIELVLHVE